MGILDKLFGRKDPATVQQPTTDPGIAGAPPAMTPPMPSVPTDVPMVAEPPVNPNPDFNMPAGMAGDSLTQPPPPPPAAPVSAAPEPPVGGMSDLTAAPAPAEPAPVEPAPVTTVEVPSAATTVDVPPPPLPPLTTESSDAQSQEPILPEPPSAVGGATTDDQPPTPGAA